jgi:hypothetical protein
MPDFSQPHCLYVSETMFDKNHGQFIPSMIFANESGHFPMRGNGKGSLPWFVGKTIEEAERNVKAMNAEKYGINEEQAMEILISSMKS